VILKEKEEKKETWKGGTTEKENEEAKMENEKEKRKMEKEKEGQLEEERVEPTNHRAHLQWTMQKWLQKLFEG